MASGKERARRKIAFEKNKFNGSVADTALNGVDVLSERESGKDVWKVTLSGDRALSGDLFDELFNLTGTLGVWLDFPSDARVGGEERASGPCCAFSTVSRPEDVATMLRRTARSDCPQNCVPTLSSGRRRKA